MLVDTQKLVALGRFGLNSNIFVCEPLMSMIENIVLNIFFHVLERFMYKNGWLQYKSLRNNQLYGVNQGLPMHSLFEIHNIRQKKDVKCNKNLISSYSTLWI